MTKVFAHRGSAHRDPENTIAAFLEARRLGADGVELDVRRSADGALVVHHDAAIEGIGVIADRAVSDLPEEIALLSEVLIACGGVEINVEIKNDPNEPGHDGSGALVDQVLSVVEESGQKDSVIISSFDLPTLEAVRSADSIIAIGWLVDPRVPPLDLLEDLVTHGFTAIHPYFAFTDEALVRAAHEAGISVNVWTANLEPDIERLVSLGVDAVITDDVTVARLVVDR